MRKPGNPYHELMGLSGYSRIEDLKRLNFILQEIESRPGNAEGKKVLEIGCGNGNMAIAIGSKGYAVLGIDIDDTSIQNAISQNSYAHVEFETVAAEDLDLKEKFDVILCSEVLEHLHDPGVIMAHVDAHLKKDGIFIVTVPNGYGPRELLMTKPMQYLQRKNMGNTLQKVKKTFGFGNGTVQSDNPDLTHIHFFSRKSITKLCADYGFAVKSFQKSDCFANIFPYSIIAKRSSTLQKLDCKIADIAPSLIVSGFYMSLQLAKKS